MSDNNKPRPQPILVDLAILLIFLVFVGFLAWDCRELSSEIREWKQQRQQKKVGDGP